MVINRIFIVSENIINVDPPEYEIGLASIFVEARI